MISNGKGLYIFIDNVLNPFGYIRKKDTWYLETDECICFFALVKSPYGGRYDHVMGAFVKEIMQEKDQFPKYYKADLKYTLYESIDSEEVKQTFDLRLEEFVSEERELRIKKYLDTYVTPFLDEVSSKDGIKKAIQRHKRLTYYVTKSLKKLLNLPYEP